MHHILNYRHYILWQIFRTDLFCITAAIDFKFDHIKNVMVPLDFFL